MLLLKMGVPLAPTQAELTTIQRMFLVEYGNRMINGGYPDE